jgi:hypothetical protein
MNFKHDKDRLMFHELHAVLQLIILDMNWYTVTNFGKSLTVTSTVSTPEEDRKLKRVSKAHQNKIAVDLRARDLSKREQAELNDYINYKPEYREYHYLSMSGVKRLAFIHNSGYGIHWHVSLHSSLAIKH